jgi:hypothetical protein
MRMNWSPGSTTLLGKEQANGEAARWPQPYFSVERNLPEIEKRLCRLANKET